MGAVEAGAERVVGRRGVRARRRRGEKGGRWEEEGRRIVCGSEAGTEGFGGMVEGGGGGGNGSEGWRRGIKERDGEG